MTTRKIIRVDGTEELLPSPITIAEAGRRIGAAALDTVVLRQMGHPLHVMLVDDNGVDAGKPANKKATELYWANCYPGTTHQIRGDVVIAPDGDFA